MFEKIEVGGLAPDVEEVGGLAPDNDGTLVGGLVQKAPVFNILNERRIISKKHYSRKQLTNVINKIDRTINFTDKEVDGNHVRWYYITFKSSYLVSIKLDKYGLYMYCNASTESYRKFCKNEREVQAFINQLKHLCK